VLLALSSRGIIDVAILVSGDGDLAEAVRSVKEVGKHVELVAFKRGCSMELIQAADVIRHLRPEDMGTFYLRAT